MGSIFRTELSERLGDYWPLEFEMGLRTNTYNGTWKFVRGEGDKMLHGGGAVSKALPLDLYFVPGPSFSIGYSSALNQPKILKTPVGKAD